MTSDVSLDNSAAPDASHELLAQLPALACQLREQLSGVERLVILTHANADADAVASALGIATICGSLGVEPQIISTGDGQLPPNLTFITGSDRLRLADVRAVSEADLLILVDCSDERRLGPLYDEIASDLERQRSIVNIDHHVTNTRFGSFNIVIPEAAATAEIIAGICDALEIPLSATDATTLLAGIYGDTLALCTPSTTPATVRAAATLLERGASLDQIVDQLFRLKPYSSVRLWGEALQRAQWQGSLIWTQIEPDMLERCGASRSEAEGLVNFLAGTIGSRASALLYRESWGWRVSMRTIADDINVADILRRFSGGGHPRAAGVRLAPGDDARDSFLVHVARALEPADTDCDSDASV